MQNTNRDREVHHIVQQQVNFVGTDAIYILDHIITPLFPDLLKPDDLITGCYIKIYDQFWEHISGSDETI